mmetsp:Transcript_2078/g.9126  ORF Transcript_2078/g.9126 Transcript_2078/m.9126 type:complete len:209 (+) Transcript_2078:675-1301(+)
MLCQKPIRPHLIATQRLHDEQVMILVPLLGEVHALGLSRPAPPAEAFVEVKHRDVAEVRHPRHGFEEPKALDRPPVEQAVEHPAQNGVRHKDRQGRRNLRPLGFPCPHRIIVQPQLLQLHPKLLHPVGAVRIVLELLLFPTQSCNNPVQLAAEVLGGRGENVWRRPRWIARAGGKVCIDSGGAADEAEVVVPRVRDFISHDIELLLYF